MTVLLLSALWTAAQIMPPETAGVRSVPPVEKRTPPSADEPIAPYSLPRAVAAIDRAAVGWTRQHNCGSCHTTYPYLMARSLLREPVSPAYGEVRSFFENRVAHWGDTAKSARPRWDAEVISTASALACSDAYSKSGLTPRTAQALERMWTLQRAGGGFEWLKCGWPPLEHDDYYGAIVAALGAGHAPGDYAHSSQALHGLDLLRDYFRKTPPPDLHHRTMLLWAATRLDGLMDSHQKAETIQALRKLQQADGGWCLPALGAWKRRDGSPNDPRAASDGYATGLILLVLQEAGVPGADPAIERGIAWLKTHQRASGRWFTRSLNDDEDHYIADAGTCLAVMALTRNTSAEVPRLSRQAMGGSGSSSR